MPGTTNLIKKKFIADEIKDPREKLNTVVYLNWHSTKQYSKYLLLYPKVNAEFSLNQKYLSLQWTVVNAEINQ